MHGPNGAHQLLLHHGGLFGFQNMVCEDPGHGHLDGELDAAAHGQLQEELPEPELGQVTALLQSFCNTQRIPVTPMLHPWGWQRGQDSGGSCCSLAFGYGMFF